MAIQGNENHNPRHRVRIEGLSHLLHPPLLDEVGLASGLVSYLEGFTERSKIKVELELPELGRLPQEAETSIFPGRAGVSHQHSSSFGKLSS